MTGFRSVAEWANASDSGRVYLTTFRKAVASAATVANDFIDYTYFGIHIVRTSLKDFE